MLLIFNYVFGSDTRSILQRLFQEQKDTKKLGHKTSQGWC